MMKLPPLALLAGLLSLLAGCTESNETPGARRAHADGHNLLLVTLDTLRVDRIGTYGYAGANTPTLDALAARGTTFEEAFTPAPMTLPAHATMMTGLLPPEHGARVNGAHRLADGVPTLAEWLAEAGYRTGAFVAAFVLDEKFGLARGFDHYDDDLSEAYEQELTEGLSTYRSGKLVVDAALAWLAEGDQEQSFFMWVHLYDAHYPWHPHGPDVEDPNAETGSYDGEVTFADRQAGRLVDRLVELGLEDETVVVMLADHGEGLGDHGEIEHAYLLNEEVLHVPWIMAGPGVQAGLRVSALVSLEDFQPTVLELLGVKGGGARGRSLAGALRGEALASGTSYAETELPWTSFRWSPQYSLTTERWKYVRTPQAELYDRSSDRGEVANLAVSKPDILEQLDAELLALEATLTVRESDVAPITQDEVEQLSALGYVDVGGSDLPTDRAGLADVKERLEVKGLATKLRRGLAEESIGIQEHVEIARQLVHASPETPSFHSGLGEALVKAGDYQNALPEFSLTVDMAPTDAGAHYQLGDALQQLGRTAEARPHLEMALELAPDMAAAHVGMGNVLRSEGRSDLAAGEYTEALTLRPKYAEAYYNLGMTFMDRNMGERAVESFGSALEHKPGWGIAHATLANLLMSMGRVEESVEHFEGALEESPTNVDLLNDSGVALHQLGKAIDARDRYVAALKLQPDFMRARINLANLAFEFGEDEAALEQYQEALQRAPGAAEPVARLARFLATTPNESLHDGERAVVLAERAAELTGGKSARVLDTLGIAYAAVGRFTEAVAAAHRGTQRAGLDGDTALAKAIEEHLALFALDKPFILERTTTEPVPAAASSAVPEDS